MRRAASFLALAALVAGVAAPSASAGQCIRLGVDSSGQDAPITKAAALAIARRTAAAREHPADRFVVRSVCGDWQVLASKDRKTVLLVTVDAKTGRVKESWGGIRAQYPFARGSSSLFVGPGAEWFIAGLTLVFLIPFLDPRRLRRALHTDLLILLGLLLSLTAFGFGWIELSTPLAALALAGLTLRMIWLARSDKSRPDPLVPFLSARVLIAAAVALLAARTWFNFAHGAESDVGYASVFGAQSLLDGYSIYSQGTVPAQPYGPAMHLAYLPFAWLFPLPGGILTGSGTAQDAAAVTFDVLVAVALYALGRRLRPGARGHGLGAVLAFGWAANPLGFYADGWSSNDGFIALCSVLALLALQSVPGRSLAGTLAAAAKWVPAYWLPLLAVGTKRPDRRTILVFVLVALVTAMAVTWPFLPEGGVREIYDVALGDIVNKLTPFSIWGLYGIPNAARQGYLLLVAGGAIAAAFVPRTRDVATVAALLTAVTTAAQLGFPHWHYTYISWFVPSALVAVALRHERTFA